LTLASLAPSFEAALSCAISKQLVFLRRILPATAAIPVNRRQALVGSGTVVYPICTIGPPRPTWSDELTCAVTLTNDEEKPSASRLPVPVQPVNSASISKVPSWGLYKKGVARLKTMSKGQGPGSEQPGLLKNVLGPPESTSVLSAPLFAA
jgi:hypothetical protein